MKRLSLPAVLVIFAALAATPAAAQAAGAITRAEPLHAVNPSMSLAAPTTSPLGQQVQDDYATELRGAQATLLQQNPSGMTRQERSVGHALNGFAPR